MAKGFNNLKDLEKYLQGVINDVLKEEVAEVIKDEIQFSVVNTVYIREPKIYKRRYLKNGSLGDKETMDEKLIQDGVLSVTPNADFNYNFKASDGYYDTIDRSKSLAENIEYGYGEKNTWYRKPRGFIKATVDNLKENKNHIHAMSDGLKNKLGDSNIE